MRVELINPNNATNAANIPFLQKGLLSWTAKAYSPPLNLSMIAAYTPPNIDVSITDECVSPIDFEKDVDLIGLTAYTNSACRAYEIADAFRKRGVTVIMGGVHVSNLPGEALEHCDAVVIGEGEPRSLLLYTKKIEVELEGQILILQAFPPGHKIDPIIPSLTSSFLTCPHGQHSRIAGMQYLIGNTPENPPANPRASVG